MGLMGPGFTNTARIAVYCVLYVLLLYYVLIQTIHGPRCTRHVPRIEPLMKPKILATGEHVSTYAWLTASLESAWNRPTGRYTGIHDIPIPRRLRRRIPIPGRLRRPYPYPVSVRGGRARTDGQRASSLVDTCRPHLFRG